MQEYTAVKNEAGTHALLSGRGIQSAGTRANPFEQIDIATSHAEEVASRVGGLADRLCGAVPATAPIEGSEKLSPSVFNHLRENGGRLHRALARMEEALSRIEASLPSEGLPRG